MEAVAVRKKLHAFIDRIPDSCLSSLEPLLAYLAGRPIKSGFTGFRDFTEEEQKLAGEAQREPLDIESIR